MLGTIRPELPPRPIKIRLLPVDERGYPVPWFVQWFRPNGSACEEEPDWKKDHPDFRIVDSRKRVFAIRRRLCWVCGQPLGSFLAFTIGPMCAINRISSEPPSHRECAEWSAKACPFLTRPQMVRRENDLPEEPLNVAGIMVKRNPGVTLVWITRSFTLQRSGPGKEDYLLKVGDPIELAWYAEGRAATRAEVRASIDGGLPTLLKAAEMDGPEGERECAAAIKEVERLLPVG